MNKKLHPPKFAIWLLNHFLFRNEGNEKLGDLEEGFWIKATEDGISKAKFWYWKQVITTIPVSIKNSIIWGGIMFGNYFKIAIRNIRKYKAYSTINILGLAVGMACTILIMMWVSDELSYDTFHENGDNIYRIIPTVSGDVWTSSPWALIENLKRDYPEIEKASWYYNAGVSATYKEKSFNESIALVAPDFFEMFTFPYISGNPQTALININSVVISERTALKYFGNEDPMGKVITLDNQVDLTITGIMENVHTNSHIQFDLVSRPEVFVSKERMQSWSMDCPSYIMLSKGVDYQKTIEKISSAVDRYDKRGVYDCTISLQPLSRIYLYALNGTDPILYVYIFSAIALLVLLIASINFMNLSTARSATRAKEIGMRKVIGAKRNDIIKQFFSESILLSFIALVIALIMVYLFLPTFNTLSGKQLEIDVFSKSYICLGLLFVPLFTGILSGIYPSLYLSSFQPVTIMKSTIVKGGKSHFLRRGLIIFQFAAAVSLIISTGVILKQLNYIKTKDLGFNRDNVLIINLDDELLSKYVTIKQELLMNKNIANVSSASNLPLNTSNNDAVSWEGKSSENSVMFNFVSTDYDYFETLEMKMKYGRSFSKEHSTDIDNYIINETALKMIGYENPIGRKFTVYKTEGIIIGIVKDFHGTSFHNEIRPTFFMMREYDVLPKRRMFIRINSNNIPETIDYIKERIEKFSPEYIFAYQFLDDYFNQMYTSEANMQRLLEYFTFLAVFISCLGLLGLASFMAEQKTKEIAIRKVLGAKTFGIISKLSKEFVILVAISNIIAWPLAYHFMSSWMESFKYRTNIGLAIFILSALGALVIAVSTVSFQAYKAAKTNPVESLKHE